MQQEDLLTHDAVVDALVKHHRARDASETGDLGDERSQREVLVNSVVSNQHDRVEGVTHAVVNFNVQGVARVRGSGRWWHSRTTGKQDGRGEVLVWYRLGALHEHRDVLGVRCRGEHVHVSWEGVNPTVPSVRQGART